MKLNIQQITVLLGAAGCASMLSSCSVTATTPAPATQTTVETAYAPGYVAPVLPTGYRTVSHRGVRYYTHNNVYYRPSGSGYVVVTSPF